MQTVALDLSGYSQDDLKKEFDNLVKYYEQVLKTDKIEQPTWNQSANQKQTKVELKKDSRDQQDNSISQLTDTQFQSKLFNKNMAFQMSQRQQQQQQQPQNSFERQAPAILQLQKILQKQPKQKPSNSQQRGTQQPQQIQHKMSQKRLVDEIKQLNKKLETNGISVNQTTDVNNSSLMLQNQIPINSFSNVGRNSQQGIYQNIQLRSTSGLQNLNANKSLLAISNTQALNSSGYIATNERSLLLSGSGGFNQNQTISQINPSALNMSSQSLERPVSSQSNGRKCQSFLTPQRQIKQSELNKGKKLILKPAQINKTQLSPPNHNQQILPNNQLYNKDKVMMDKKTYDELMNYLIKAECKRIERDRMLSNQQQQTSFQVSGQINQKRPNSTLKRLGPIQNNIERVSNNPARILYQNINKDILYPTQNAILNNSTFQAVNDGRNSKQGKAPQKKLIQQSQKLKNIYQQPTKQLIGASSSLQQIKRNNYVNELTQAYSQGSNNTTNNHNMQPTQQVSPFFNINNNQSIPTSKKGTQKKIILQDTLQNQDYQQMTQQSKQLHQLLQVGKIQNSKVNPVINPQYIYMPDKIQSARGVLKDKDLIGGGTSKVSNLLLHKEQQIRGVDANKQPMSHRDNTSGVKVQNAKPNTQMQPIKLNKVEELSPINRLTSAKNAKKYELIPQQEIITKSSSKQRLNIQIDSDLLYGSDEQSRYQIGKGPVHTTIRNFDTFGDSEVKITAVSELQSPDRTIPNSNNQTVRVSQQKDLKLIDADPYSNKSYGQEFHYSGSFGIPQTFNNQSSHEVLAQSMINQTPNNLSFSVCQNDISIVTQKEQTQEMKLIQQQNFFNQPMIIVDHEEMKGLRNQGHDLDLEDDEEDDDEVQQIIDQPFYIYDDQNEEGIFIIDSECNDQLDIAQQNADVSKTYVENINSSSSLIDNSTVEAVKKRLINDPQYRRELLQRVLPQFAKLNEQFSNSFIYRLKYSDQNSSQQSSTIQKSGQSTQRQQQQLMQTSQSNCSQQKQSKYQVISDEDEDDILYTLDPKQSIEEDNSIGNHRAAQAILESINRSLNKKKYQLAGNIQNKNTYEESDELPIDEDDNDEDETNTVIENECENDYTNIYQSLEDNDDEPEEIKRQREFQLQKLQLKMQIQKVTSKKN